MEFNDIKIRQAEAYDIESIAEIKVSGWQSAYRGIVDDEYLDSMSVSEQIINLQNYSLETIFVAEKDNEILGFCRISETNSEIREIYVKPSVKRMGIGSKLFNYALDHFEQLGKEKLYLGCFKENYNARKFYEKMGGVSATEEDIEVDGKCYPMVSYVFNLSLK